MRDYGVVSPQFWLGKTGKSLRGDPVAQVIALYLMTSPHARMTGVFYCPLDYIAKETGTPLEGASKGLERLSEGGFCTFDYETEEVFVHRMASFQIGEKLDAKDNRCKAVAKEVEKIASDSLRKAFVATYSEAFNIPKQDEKSKPLRSPSKAPSKPGTGAGTGTGDNPPIPPKGEPAGFIGFWSEWPSNGRKGSKSKCLAVWQRAGLEACSATVVAHVRSMKASHDWRKDGGQFVPMPLTYLNQRRWDGSAADLISEAGGEWFRDAGFSTEAEANNARCWQHNASEFRDGQRIAEAA